MHARHLVLAVADPEGGWVGAKILLPHLWLQLTWNTARCKKKITL